MSSDNGVYVLETAGPEYRVVHAQAIDNIYGEFDDDKAGWKGDPDMLIEYFGGSKVFTDIQDAMDEAEKLAGEIDWIEDGICLIPDFKDLVFGEL